MHPLLRCVWDQGDQVVPAHEEVIKNEPAEDDNGRKGWVAMAGKGQPWQAPVAVLQVFTQFDGRADSFDLSRMVEDT